MRCEKVLFQVEHDPHWFRELVEGDITVEGECRGYHKASNETPTERTPMNAVETRLTEIYDDVLGAMHEAGIPDTPQARLEILTILRDRWLNEPKTETERFGYIIVIIAEIQKLENELEASLA